MVGSKGDQSRGLDQASRRTLVHAVNKDHAVLVRTILLDPRPDGKPWAVGDEIGLLGYRWIPLQEGCHISSTVTKILAGGQQDA